jgi:hypothetical protein
MPESPKADLHRYLQAARDALLWKLDGLSEYDVRHNAGVGAAGTNDAIDYGPGAHQIMDEEEQRTVHVGGQWCCRGVADDDVNVVPPVLGHAGTGVRGHGLAQIDARDVTARTDSCYEVGKVRPRTQPTSSTWSPGRSRRRRTTPGQSWRVHRCAHGPHVDDPPPHPSALLPKGQPKFELDVVGVT